MVIGMTRRSGLALMIGVFLVFMVWAMYTFITSKYPGANDFLLRWQGARSTFEGLNPYSREATDRVEFRLYGHVAEPNQYPGDFVYPFYTVFLVAPFAAIEDYALASAVWLVLLGACVAVSFALLADLFEWRPPRWLLLIGMVWALLFYPSARGMFLGQPGLMVVCLEFLALWALSKNHDVLAGVVLSISTLKPTVGFLLIPFLLLWGLVYRRWRFVGSFVALSLVMVAASFVLLPSWLSDWMAQVMRYPSYTAIGSPVWVVTTIYLPFLGRNGEIVLTVLLVALMVWAWQRVLWQRSAGMFDWTVAITFTVTHLVAYRTATPHFAVFLFVLVFYFKEITQADRRRGPWIVLGIMLALLVALWWLFVATVANREENPIVYLPLPFGSLILLWFTRRRWWKAYPTATTAVSEPLSPTIAT
jgi:glycosyl transferase family 87